MIRMGSPDLERIKSKLFALNLRYDEVDQELSATRARASRLEKELEDARLASLMGDEAGDPAEIGPALERVRGMLDNQQQLLERIQSSRWETRLRYILARREEITQHANRQRAEGPPSVSPPDGRYRDAQAGNEEP
jgi:chromosome segregation ATPase